MTMHIHEDLLILMAVITSVYFLGVGVLVLVDWIKMKFRK